MLEHGDTVGQEQRLVAVILDRDPLVRSVKVLFLADLEVQGRRIVDSISHLVDVPVGTEEGRVANPHVIPEAFHLLDVPEREGVVVSVSDQEAVLTY